MTRTMFILTLTSLLSLAGLAWGHGNVTPQSVNIRGLEELGEEWRDTNPYRESHPQHELAVDVGKSAYNQNCARRQGV